MGLQKFLRSGMDRRRACRGQLNDPQKHEISQDPGLRVEWRHDGGAPGFRLNYRRSGRKCLCLGLHSSPLCLRHWAEPT